MRTMNEYEIAVLGKYLEIAEKAINEIFENNPELREKEARNLYLLTNSLADIRSRL